MIWRRTASSAARSAAVFAAVEAGGAGIVVEPMRFRQSFRVVEHPAWAAGVVTRKRPRK